jgi:nitrite reductase (NADH) small subunit
VITVLSEYVRVGQLSDFPAGSLKTVEIAGKQLLLANLAGELFAIENTCTHRGGPLNEGTLEGKVVTCPWHGGQFDVTTGKVVGPPPQADEPTYSVKVHGNDVMIKSLAL